jgi:anti-anti-sigma regulatory factor
MVRNGPAVTIVAGGLLDLTNSSEFERELQQAAATAESVTVDFRDALFIDTAIVQYLATAAMTLMKRGSRLHLVVKPGSHPERVIGILGFAHLMSIEVAT